MVIPFALYINFKVISMHLEAGVGVEVWVGQGAYEEAL